MSKPTPSLVTQEFKDVLLRLVQQQLENIGEDNIPTVQRSVSRVERNFDSGPVIIEAELHGMILTATVYFSSNRSVVTPFYDMDPAQGDKPTAQFIVQDVVSRIISAEATIVESFNSVNLC